MKTPKNERVKKADEPRQRFTISGGPCIGYTICDQRRPLLLHFLKMWDAIVVRDKLRSGMLHLSPELIER